MTSYVSAELRKLVSQRAQFRCEYCLIRERDTYLGCHVDHIISEKHGGATAADNLALACAFCNRCKGTDLGSIAPSGELTRFYNPRTDVWSGHFEVTDFTIEAKTEVGAVTVALLQMNSPDRIEERKLLGFDLHG